MGQMRIRKTRPFSFDLTRGVTVSQVGGGGGGRGVLLPKICPDVTAEIAR